MKAYGIRRRDMGCKWGCCLGKYRMYHRGFSGSEFLRKSRKRSKQLSHKAERARTRMEIINYNERSRNSQLNY